MTETCAGPCERPMVRTKNRAAVPLGFAQHLARGFCTCCYSHVRRRAGAPPKRREIVINGTADLAEMGLTRAEIAARFGLKPDSLAAAHRRAGVPCPI